MLFLYLIQTSKLYRDVENRASATLIHNSDLDSTIDKDGEYRTVSNSLRTNRILIIILFYR